ncbi:hypothetical protein E5S67_02737 [Microcoleus sp. IPMA8]|jgi:hypothetical protein|uniref:Uncharacterized protein n=1 Tax=Microcoleus asticus IPMA8 TaxID=2563858 RepID=A0ABX2CZF6_9CYAN|nr:hypothetical protein [Microcoleus asticus IPMA8]
MNIMESILQQMPGISQPQKKFLITLFSTILLARRQDQLHESQSL